MWNNFGDAIAEALIDIKKEEVTLRVNVKNKTFNVFKVVKQPSNVEECSFIRVIDHLVNVKES